MAPLKKSGAVGATNSLHRRPPLISNRATCQKKHYLREVEGRRAMNASRRRKHEGLLNRRFFRRTDVRPTNGALPLAVVPARRRWWCWWRRWNLGGDRGVVLPPADHRSLLNRNLVPKLPDRPVTPASPPTRSKLSSARHRLDASIRHRSATARMQVSPTARMREPDWYACEHGGQGPPATFLHHQRTTIHRRRRRDATHRRINL
jgi:hypothetical protein